MGTYDYAQAGYSPETVKYLDDMVAQRQALSDKYGPGIALNNPEFMYSRQVQQPASDGYDTVYTPEEDIRRIMASGQGASEIFDPGYNVQSWGGSRNPNQFDFVRLGAGKTYTYTDNNTGQTYTASTPEQVQALTQLAKSQSGVGNNSASWSIKDSSGKEVASDTSYTPDFWKQSGQMIADSLPAIMATMALGPGAGWALSGLTAGGATAAYQGAKGASLEDSLLAGLKAGVLTGATTFASPYINSALTNAGLDFPGMSSLFPAGSPGAFDMGGAGGAYGPSTGGVSNVGGVEQALVRPGAFYPGVGALAGVLPAQLATGITNSPSYAGQPGVEEIRQTADRLKDTTIDEYGNPFFVPTGLAAPSYDLADYDTGEQLGYDNKPADPAKEDPSTLDTLDKYLRYASAGMTGASLLSGLLGGGAGAKDGSGTIPQGFSTQLPSTFSAKLPTGSAIPAFGGGVTPESRMGRTATDLGDIDYTRYGFGPERSFFGNVPVRAAKGGPMAVQNISDGRSDDIPAVLSDGEYVIDAETVALLGNGSNKAGAKQLDRFRANIRKHKGKELAKGRFSVNAKKPQAYLAGGRT